MKSEAQAMKWYDVGRLVIWQIGPHQFMGLRFPSLQPIWGDCPQNINVRHDGLEATERMGRAGVAIRLNTPESHRKPSQDWKLARNYITGRVQ